MFADLDAAIVECQVAADRTSNLPERALPDGAGGTA
jgi:hypothetical protein